MGMLKLLIFYEFMAVKIDEFQMRNANMFLKYTKT